MPYFSNAPGPTPSEELPQPLSVMEQIKNVSDASRNTKRKLSEETSGKNDFGGFIFNLLSFLILFFSNFKVSKKSSTFRMPSVYFHTLFFNELEFPILFSFLLFIR
jgi:hypothetical protein